MSKTFSWAIIGAGPAGITAVGLLLDAGVRGEDILWLDPYFQVGDFGRYWGEVNSNTRVALFLDYLNGVQSFQYAKKSEKFALDALDKNGFTLLKHVADPLQFVTQKLRAQVFSTLAVVKSLSIQNQSWKIETEKQAFFAEKIILATGAQAKSLDYPSVEKIDLVTALTPSLLKKFCNQNDTVAVFGSSHSAMIVIRALIEAGVKHVVNFFMSPLRYAVLMDDWILYDDTGLKGETALWVRDNISKKCLPNISRYLSTPEHIDAHLPRCNKAVYAVGFAQRHLPIENISTAHYDFSNGIIAPGLFGVGIGFPIAVTDPFGRQEWNVGVWKFYKNIKKALPLWQKYEL